MFTGIRTRKDISPSDRRVSDCKRDIESLAQNVEECTVYVHEFQRTPEREFNLALGDVVFFGLMDKA